MYYKNVFNPETKYFQARNADGTFVWNFSPYITEFYDAVMIKKFANNLEYQRKAVLLEKQNKAYNEYCEENNLRPLADRIQIARWDRKQAAAARGAAQRYKNARD